MISYGDFSSGNPSVFGHSSDEVDVKIPDSTTGEIKKLQQAIDEGDIGSVKSAYFNIIINSIRDYDTGPIGFNPKYAEARCYALSQTGIIAYQINGKAIGNKSELIKEYSNAFRYTVSSGTSVYPPVDKFIAVGTGMSGQITQWSKNGIKISINPGPGDSSWYSSLDCDIIIIGS